MVSVSFIFVLIFMISLPINFGFLFVILGSFRCKVRLLIWDFSCSLRASFVWCNFFLELLFLHPRFWIMWFHFHLSVDILIFSLSYSVVHCLFNNILFNLYVIVLLQFFSFLVGFSLQVLCSEKILYMIPVFLYWVGQNLFIFL